MTNPARTDDDTRRDILAALEPYRNRQHGRNRYNTPWRAGADGGTLAVDEDSAYGLGLKWYDHKDDTKGNGYSLLDKLAEANIVIARPGGQRVTVTKKPRYESLADYAQRHGVPVEVFEAAGWHEMVRGRMGKAFAFPTAGGTRYRYADERAAGRKFDHDKGTVATWYGLERAVALAHAQDAPLILCNGEPSTLVAQHYGAPACCVTGGERGSIADELLEELREVWAGPIVVAFDCDDTGRRAGSALAAHLRAFGVAAKAVDLGGSAGFDLADFCRLHQADAPAAFGRCPEITVKAPSGQAELIRDWKADGTTAAQLQHTEFPPEIWVVDGILPAGACLLAAKPKKGKSWLALQAAVCVSMGRPFLGRYGVTRGRVLFLDLEGTQRRIKKRLRAMLGVSKVDWPDTFHIFTEWPQGPEGLAQLEAWLIAHPDTRLVVIDVLASFRRTMDMKEPFYQYDRETVKPINDLLEKYDCAGILVHHMNKARVDDVFDSVSGSTGLISVTNTQWAMGQHPEDRQSIIFALQGRDLEGAHTEPLSLRWNDYAHQHEVEGKAAEVTISVERKAVLDVLDDDEARTPKEIAELLGKPAAAVKKLLAKMIDDGQVDKAGYGQYVLVRGHSGHPGSSGHSGHSGHSSGTLVTQGVTRVTGIPARVTGGGHSLEAHQDALNEPLSTKSDQSDRDRNGDAFATVPASWRTPLRLFLQSTEEDAQAKARELCAQYGVDYEAALASVRRAA